MSSSTTSDSIWGENAIIQGSLVYRNSWANCSNLLLIDSSVQSAHVIYGAVNAETFPVVYNSHTTTRSELLDFLQSKCSTIPRIGLCFSTNIDTTLFLEGESFFSVDNVAWVAFALNLFQVSNVDYFGCSTLQESAWVDYYAQIMAQTSAVVGASSDNTGNIKYGGDWVMESTCQDIEYVYFTENIEYYSYLLDFNFAQYRVVLNEVNQIAYGYSRQDYGQYGNGVITGSYLPYPVQVNTSSLPAGKTMASISNTNGATFVTMTDGTLYSIGRNDNGALGVALNALTATPVTTFQQVVLPDNRLVKMVTTENVCVHILTTDGKVYTYGSLTAGTHGNTAYPNTTNTYTAVPMTIPAGKTPCYIHSCGTRMVTTMTDGTVYYTGAFKGQTTAPTTVTPTLVPDSAGLDFKVFENCNFPIGLTKTGEVYVWNVAGSTGGPPYLVPLPAGKTVANVKAGAGHGMVLFTDGTLYGIGNGIFPVAGASAVTGAINTTALVKLDSITGKAFINVILATDTPATFALTNDGMVYCAGNQSNYAFGVGGTASTKYTTWTPTKLDANTTLTGITSLGVNQPNLVISSSAPAAPTINSVTSGSGQLTVAFTSGSNNGSVITDFKYSIDGGSSYVSVGASGVAFTITGLTNGTSYTVTMIAVNAVGTSPASTGVSGTPAIQMPAPPTINSVTAGNAQLVVAFTAGAINGSPITDYKYALNGGSYVSLGVVSSPFTISGLTNGTSYTVTMVQVNANGTSSASSGVSGTPVVPLPAAPTINSVTAGNGQLTVAFTAGSSNGSPFTDYKYSINGGSSYVSIGISSNPFIISGLTNGTSYTVTMVGVNANGTSAASSGVSGTPFSTPSSPTINSVTAGNGQLSVAFTAGANNGSAITNYKYSVDGSTYISAGTTVSPIVITGLTGGVTYTVTLKAVNSAGDSAASEGSSGTPFNVPASPTINSITAGNGQLSVAFTAGANNGSAITNYKYSVDGTNYISAGTTVSPITISGLNNGTSYTVTLKAVNAIGDSAASAGSSGMPVSVPASPTINSVTAGNGQLSVAFTAGFDNGSAITDYKYSVDGSTYISAGTAVSPITISGLNNGTSYTVTLKAVNAIGDSAASAGSSGMPVSVPASPTINSITPGDKQLSVAFTAGFDNGSAITDYKYSVNGSSYISSGTLSSPITISGLNNRTTYEIILKAVNQLGDSEASSGLSAEPVGSVPSSPTIDSLIGGNGQIVVNFTAGSDNGDAITGYKYALNGGSYISAGTTTSSPITITGLTNGTSYTIALKAINVNGDSLASTESSTTPYTVPSAPTIESIVPGVKSAVVHFVDGSNNGSALTGYKYSLNGGNSYTSVDVESFSSPYTFSNLTAGQTYGFSIKAVNAAGESSDASSNFTPYDAPLQPQIIGIFVLNGGANVYYTSNANGSPITNVSYILNGGAVVSAGTANSPFTITGLTNGTSYSISIITTNAGGDSVESLPASFMPTVPLSRPEPPTITSVSAADRTLTVAFELGSNVGGSPILAYQYSIDSGASYQNAMETVSPLTIRDLSNGTQYAVLIRAVSGAGSSNASNSMSGTPSGRPSAPKISSVSSGNGALLVTFIEGADNGSAINGHSYSLDGHSYTAVSVSDISGGVRTFTIPSSVVSLGSSYTVYLKSQNALGSSVESVPSSPATVYLAPIAPTLETVTAGDGFLSVAFTQESNGYSVLRYEYAIQGGVWESLSAYSAASTIASPLVINGLPSGSGFIRLVNGTPYTIYVRAVTAVGTSEVASVSGTPLAGVLDAPIVTGVVPGNQSLSVSYVLGETNGAGYAILYSLNGEEFVQGSAASNPFDISGVTNATPYTVSLKVQNGSVVSAASASFPAVKPGSLPSPPNIDSITTNTTNVAIDFTDGNYYNSPLVGYKYSKDAGSTYKWANSNEAPLVIYDVSPGTTYHFKIQAVTEYGVSEESDQVDATMPALQLNSPVILSAVASDGSISLRFLDGFATGLTVSGYKYSIDNGSTFIAATDVSNGVLNISSGLTNGTTYQVSMKSVSGDVESARSNTISAMPTRVPEAPSISAVTAGNQSASISFSAGNSYGHEILGYKYSLDGTNYRMAPGDSSSPIVLYGLTNGQSYTVRLKAFTQIGESTASSASSAFVPSAAPSAPIITGVSVGHQTGSIQILDGDSNGSEITQYSYSFDGTTYTSIAGLSKPLVITGLTNGQTYNVQVKATTSVGTSSASNMVAFVPASKPEAPIVSGVTAGDKSVSIEFVSGNLNGGSLNGYMYSLNDSTDKLWAAGKSSPLVIGGLANATSYTFKLYAVSNIGVSDACDVSGSYTPVGVPGRPSVSSLVAADQQITVSVTNGATNGSPITSYKYSFDGVSYAVATSNPFTITGLTNGTEYSLYVISTNAAGDSPASLLSDTAIPYGAPGPATILSVAPANRALRVSLSSDNMNGTAEVIGYKYSFDGTNYLYRIDTSANQFTTAEVLTNGVPARVYVKRITSFGDSAASNASELVSPCNVPDAPTIISIAPKDQMGIVTFTDGSANGSPILGYKYSFDGIKYFTALQTSSPISMYNLTNGVSYTVRLKAFSAAGDSDAYTATEPIIPFNVPYAPVITSILPGDKCAYVYFNPINDNGSPITRIRYSIGGSYLDASGLTSPITVPNLTNGGVAVGKVISPYSIYIAAANIAGLSTASNTMTVYPGVPLSPVVTQLISVPDAIQIVFTPPASDNGSPILSYLVNYAGLKAPLKLIGLTSPITVPNLTNGTFYTPVLIANNKVGNSVPSNSLGSVAPCKPPDKIGIPIATAFYQYTQVDFVVPRSNGAPITKYMYSIVTDVTSPWYDASGLTSPIIIPNTPSNVTFGVKLVAVNALGTSESSLSSKSVRYTFTTPATIKTPAVTIGLGSMTVAIIPPASAGSNISKYSYSLNGGAYQDFSGLNPPFTIDISNNVDYKIQVTATNLAGTSIPSAPMAKPVRYVYLPPATGPVIASVLPVLNGGFAVSGTAVITFTAAVARNAPIIDYVYRLDSSAGTPISMGLTSPVTLTGISNMTPHVLYVYAVTSIGLSPPTLSKPFTIAYGPPSVPVIKSATFVSQNTTQATFRLSVTAPVALNGSAVNAYYYSLNGGTTSTMFNTYDVSGTSVTMTVSNVPNDISTNVVVAAMNTAGLSVWSAPVSVFAIYRAPSPPVLGVATSTTNSITVSFTASLANGSPITNYLISVNGQTPTSVGSTIAPITINGLTGKTSYTVVMYAVNSIGTSGPSVKPVTILTK